MSDPVIVIGSPRSGTSLVAGMLSRLGVWMGDRFYAPDEWNPTGYFQCLDFDDALREVVGWYDRFGFPEWTGPRAFDAGPVVELVRARVATGRLWGVKANLLPYVLAEVLGAVPGAKIVRTRRAADRSAASWHARDIVTADEAAGIIGRCRAATDGALAALGRTPDLELDYDGLIDRPADAVAALARLVGVAPTAEAASLVNPSLRRH